MKIYTRVVIDIASGCIEQAESQEYTGAIAECKGGGGSSGGGSSGTVDYPQYIKDAHSRFLGNTALVPYGISELMTTAWSGASPYAAYVPPDADDAFLGAGKFITDFTTPFELLKNFTLYNPQTEFNTQIATTSTYRDALIDAHSTQLQNEYDSSLIPRFEHGMADINAVMSSAFIIGKALIAESKLLAIAKFSKELQMHDLEFTLKRISVQMEWHRVISSSSIELARLYLAARTEMDDLDMEAAAKDALWDLDIYQYGTQVLASVSGAATSKNIIPKASKLSGALSGAMSGASMGTAISPGWGTAIGAVVGGAAGYFTA